MKQIITEALNSQDLTDKINDAAPHRVKIMKDLSEDMKEIEGTYIQKMIDLNPKISAIQAKKHKNRSDEEKALYASFVKNAKREFKAIKKAYCPVVKADGTTESPMVKPVTNLANMCRMLAYLGRDDEIQKIFTERGMTLTFDPLEKSRPEFAPTSVREELKYIFSSAEEVNNETQKTKMQIKELYMDLDPNIRFSKEDPKNLEGLKAAQFEKLVRQRAISITKSPEDYTKYCEKMQESADADITSMELTLEKSRDM